jgi:energy-converting hydrogenase Eha subunit F
MNKPVGLLLALVFAGALWTVIYLTFGIDGVLLLLALMVAFTVALAWIAPDKGVR